MKIRKDFVTNSSSSSFVVAKKNGCEKNELESFINENCRERVENLLCEIRYIDDVPEHIEIAWENEEIDKAIDYAVKEIVDGLFSIANGGMDLDNWKVSAIEVNNEDGDLTDSFLYGSGYKVKTENFKVG